MTSEKLTELSKIDPREEKSDILNVSQAMSDFTQHNKPLDDNFATIPSRSVSKSPRKKPKTATGNKPLPQSKVSDDKEKSGRTSQRALSKNDGTTGGQNSARSTAKNK